MLLPVENLKDTQENDSQVIDSWLQNVSKLTKTDKTLGPHPPQHMSIVAPL